MPNAQDRGAESVYGSQPVEPTETTSGREQAAHSLSHGQLQSEKRVGPERHVCMCNYPTAPPAGWQGYTDCTGETQCCQSLCETPKDMGGGSL